MPGAFKNAVDSLGAEWVAKPIAYVGYSFSGGIRAVEAWRLVMANFSMTQLRTQLDISLATDMTEGEFTPADFKSEIVANICAELEEALS